MLLWRLSLCLEPERVRSASNWVCWYVSILWFCWAVYRAEHYYYKSCTAIDLVGNVSRLVGKISSCSWVSCYIRSYEQYSHELFHRSFSLASLVDDKHLTNNCFLAAFQNKFAGEHNYSVLDYHVHCCFWHHRNSSILWYLHSSPIYIALITKVRNYGIRVALDHLQFGICDAFCHSFLFLDDCHAQNTKQEIPCTHRKSIKTNQEATLLEHAYKIYKRIFHGASYWSLHQSCTYYFLDTLWDHKLCYRIYSARSWNTFSLVAHKDP